MSTIIYIISSLFTSIIHQVCLWSLYYLCCCNLSTFVSTCTLLNMSVILHVHICRMYAMALPKQYLY